MKKPNQKCIVSETQETAVAFHRNEEEEEKTLVAKVRNQH